MRTGPAIRDLHLTLADARGALVSFRESCPKLLARTDASGLTRGEDWRAPCTAAATWSDAEAQRFFEDQFEAAIVGEGASHVTGYYEPEIAGSRQRRPGFDVPVYRMPDDLVREGDLAAIRTPINVLGVNYYTTNVFRAGGAGGGHTPHIAAPDAEPVLRDDLPLTAMGWEVHPDGLRDLLDPRARR